jgi:hypothetical protein
MGLLGGLAVTLLAGCNAQEQAAQEEAAQQDFSSVPDFYTNGFGWHSRTVATLPPPEETPGAHGPIGNHPDYPHYANNSGRPPTARIGNWEHPLLLPWASKVIKDANDKVNAGGERFAAAARCWPPGVPGILNFTAEPVLFLQTPNVVHMVYQRGQIVRRVYMNEEHPADLKPTWMGHSVGRYEGDEFVIDTVGIDPRSFTDEFGTPHTDQMHVVERYKIINGGPELIRVEHIPADRWFLNPENKVLRVIATIEDPGTFKEPYTVMQVYEPADDYIDESICPENNDDKFNQGLVPTPMDDTPDF